MGKILDKPELRGGFTVGGTVVVDENGNIDAPVTTTDLTTTGTTTLGNSADQTTVNGPITGVSASANSLAIGRLGATTPSLKVDSSASTAVTGLEIVAKAAAGGMVVRTISSGTNESMTIDAKGSGTVTINGTATGIVVLPAGTTIGGSTVSALGVITSASATALAVGLNGATNSSFVVDSSVGSQAAGLKVTGATAAGTVALAAISSGGDAGLSIASKGDGNLSLNNPKVGHATKAAINATATASAAEVASGYITSTSAAATVITLPTGTDLGTALGASQGTVHELYIDNTAGANPVTIAVSVNGVLSTGAVDTAGSFGDLTVASGVTGLARYTIMFSSATAFAFTRTA